MSEFMIYAVAPISQLVPNAIEEGDWTGNLLTATLLQDKLDEYMNDGPYKIYEVHIKEYSDDLR